MNPLSISLTNALVFSKQGTGLTLRSTAVDPLSTIYYSVAAAMLPGLWAADSIDNNRNMKYKIAAEIAGQDQNICKMTKLNYAFAFLGITTFCRCQEPAAKAPVQQTVAETGRRGAFQLPFTGYRITMRLKSLDTTSLSGVQVINERTGEIVQVDAEGNFTLNSVDSGDWVKIIPAEKRR